MKAPEFDGWPSIQVHTEALPWHWDWLPRWSQDWDCTSSCSLSWLLLRVEWWANRPLFPTSVTAPGVAS